MKNNIQINQKTIMEPSHANHPDRKVSKKGVSFQTGVNESGNQVPLQTSDSQAILHKKIHSMPAETSPIKRSQDSIPRGAAPAGPAGFAITAQLN